MATPDEDYGALKADLLKVMKQPDYDDGSAGPVLVSPGLRYDVLGGRARANRCIWVASAGPLGVARKWDVLQGDWYGRVVSHEWRAVDLLSCC